MPSASTNAHFQPILKSLRPSSKIARLSYRAIPKCIGVEFQRTLALLCAEEQSILGILLYKSE